MKMLTQKKGNIMNYGVSMVTGLFVITVFVAILAIVLGVLGTSTTDTTAKAVVANASAGVATYAGLSSVQWLLVALGIVLIVLFTALGAFMGKGRTTM